ncbi:hypothetical protein GR158_23500 [Shinella sp. AETb1-6]|uniref:hypothetical protein n=1 Tax=Shinella TaxID=323620 RepID=UPI00106E5C9D|nr:MULTISPECIES: hypothetical protein [Shinella]MCD1266721.1 hypothetical protein [Shinella sumterensis]MXN54073.1 hypothetical protein [Shinella sp. AETb1-6]TFE95742.1 hypothetical protein B5M44_20940 [Shinella sumterensis]
MIRTVIFSSFALLATVALTSPASALTMKECSTKYQAAKADGSAKGMKWNDFRAKNCGTDAAAEDAADEKDIAATPDKEPAKSTKKAPKSVVFPKAVDKKYSSETPGKQRLHTCVDSYRANKDNGTLGDLKWIQKGGGYWSLCNTALKS